MLVYIWFRFQLQWGFAAVVALAHDTLITLGLFSLFGQEMSLPVVAAFLTLVGYSVNDTVVVFDRIRENLRQLARQGPRGDGQPVDQPDAEPHGHHLRADLGRGARPATVRRRGAATRSRSC